MMTTLAATALALLTFTVIAITVSNEWAKMMPGFIPN